MEARKEIVVNRDDSKEALTTVWADINEGCAAFDSEHVKRYRKAASIQVLQNSSARFRPYR